MHKLISVLNPVLNPA